MSTLVSYLFSVTGLALTLIVSAAISVWQLPAGWRRRTVIASAVIVSLSTIAIVPYTIGHALAWRYHPFDRADIGPGTTAIVVLAAGDVDIRGWDGHLPMATAVEAAHILEASRVFRLLPTSWIISSGGPADDGRSMVPSSVVMRDAFVQLGVPADRIVLESTSRNTHDEAVLIAPILHDHAVQQLVLVTSQTHMRRALGAFRATGWSAVPAIATDPRRPVERWQWLLPTDRGLDATSDVVHEILGIPYYWIHGWWQR